MKKIVMLFLVGVSVLSFSGCILLAAGAAGAGTAKWMSDKVTATVDHPLEKVDASSKSVLNSIKAVVYKDTHSPGVTQILAKYPDGRQIWIDLRPVNTSTTRIDVRVGWMNGEADAQKILEQIVHKSDSWI